MAFKIWPLKFYKSKQKVKSMVTGFPNIYKEEKNC